jgi:formylglycine-generating enzyme required for sulfatase activity
MRDDLGNPQSAIRNPQSRWRRAAVFVVAFLGTAGLGRAVIFAAEELTSHLGNRGPRYDPGATPQSLGWGENTRAYPDQFAVNPTDGAELVWVPPGQFSMGSPDGDLDERPAHEVTLTQGFWLYKHEVTIGQIQKVLNYTPPGCQGQPPNHPAVNVDWNVAMIYAGKMEGVTLPTEAQWEYAARGPEGRLYPWGDEWDAARCQSGEDRHGEPSTAPVGAFPSGASWCGAMDLAGNVWECVLDAYRSDAYGVPGSPARPGTDPLVPPTTPDFRVIRGGSWRDTRFNLRCANRLKVPHDFYEVFMGFRCVMKAVGGKD